MALSHVQERCFICGIDRENFETLGLSFPNHISHDHNMWQYLWFRIHLDNKDSTSYTGQEQVLTVLQRQQKKKQQQEKQQQQQKRQQ